MLTLPMTRSWTIGGKAMTSEDHEPAAIGPPWSSEPHGRRGKDRELEREPGHRCDVGIDEHERREEESADRRVAERVRLRPVVQGRRRAEGAIGGLLVAAREVEGEIGLGADPDDRQIGEGEGGTRDDDEVAAPDVHAGQPTGCA